MEGGEPAPKKSKLPGRLISLGLLVALAAVVIGTVWLMGVFQTTTAPLRASDTFVKALVSNETNKAYGMTNDTFQDNTSLEELNEIAGTLNKNVKFKDFKVTTGNIVDQSDGSKVATINYDFKAPDDAMYELRVWVVRAKDSNDWLVEAVNSRPKDS